MKRLCFGAQPIRVVLTRHVWLQLTMMDVARRRKALALFHTLASGAGEATSSPCPGSEAVPLRVSASLGKGGEAVFAVVWERSSEGRPFFEAARGAEAIRVWSIETSDVSLHEVALYVEEAWAYGERGRRDTEGRFPMGTTNELSHPSDKWHPVHAEDGGLLFGLLAHHRPFCCGVFRVERGVELANALLRYRFLKREGLPQITPGAHLHARISGKIVNFLEGPVL